MTSPEVLAAVGTLCSACVGAAGVLIGKRWEAKTAISVHEDETKTATVSLAVDVLQGELDRKSREVSDLNTKVDGQAKEIADLKVANWLVLQHLLDVHRHFAEGHPPPPPPIPQALLSMLQG